MTIISCCNIYFSVLFRERLHTSINATFCYLCHRFVKKHEQRYYYVSLRNHMYVHFRERFRRSFDLLNDVECGNNIQTII